MLLQLMVYAKIIYLLMVVISGALCTVEDYVIMSQCAHNKAINLAAEGTVSVTDISQTQNITIVGRPDFVNNNFKIALYAKETQRYLCFNDHWKLVGMKELQDTCYFNEAIVHGYFVFRSVVDLQRRIGFTQRGRAVGPKKTVNDACYMFTKIPTDQFFHQHNHFSTPKTKNSTTTKIPKTEYTHTTQAGRGSGGDGRTKTNRFRNPQRQEDSVTHNHSGHGHGSGGGGGGGSGSGNGSKKFKKQRNGNKLQRQQKQKQEMQQQIRGHSYNLSNPKNSTYLNSSRQNLVLSQHSINNHTNKKHNISNSSNSNNNNNNNHPPQNHQVRHHHNDPNKVARRQQHDQKQKTKLRQRVRPSPSTSALVTPAVAATTTTATTSLTTAKLINASKPQHTLSRSYSDINPTSVVPTISTDAIFDSRNTMSSTLVVAKRKGRRRKGDKLHKKGLQRKLELEREQTEKQQAYSSSAGPAYDEEDEFITSSTDYAWMTKDFTMSSVKPTSASLPSWDTWYPSSSTAYTEDEDADYSLDASGTASSVTETNAATKFSATLESSSMTDLDKNTLSSQTSVPLPTSVLTTTLTENRIDETISPTVTTDLGTTTPNTSTYTQTDFWSTSLKDNTDADKATTGFTSETFNTYATPQLENTQNTLTDTDEAIFEDLNTLSTQHNKDDSENSTAAIILTTTEDDNVEEDDVSSPPTERASDAVSDSTWMEGSTSEMTSSGNYEKTSVVSPTTTKTYTNDCAYSTASTHNGSKPMTDCMFATKTTAPIANNHYKPGVTTPIQHSTKSYNDKVPKTDATNKVTTSTALNPIPIRSDKTTSFPETTSTTTITTQSHTQTQSSTKPSKTPAPATPYNHLHPVEKSVTTTFAKENTEINTAATTSTATAFSSTVHATKSPVPLALTTRKTLRKSTQRLLATPFHQLTYVRNEAGDIDIDSIDNISIYPELLDNENDEPLVKPSTSRLTMISGYLPTSATATLPESIRIAKIKINRERKRMLRLRNVGTYA